MMLTAARTELEGSSQLPKKGDGMGSGEHQGKIEEHTGM